MKGSIKKIIATLMTVSAISASMGNFTATAEMTPNPVISRNCPVYTGGSGQATAANDEHYFSFWFAAAPDYLAYDLSGVPASERKQVIAVWYNTSSYDDIGMYKNRNMEPSDYTVEVNSAEGGTYPEDGWEVVETVSGNTLSSRQHLVNMEGYNWIRLNIAKADDQEGKQASINFDIHNVSDGVYDSWLFLGDSITAGGMNNCYGTGFATYVNQIDSRYFPIQENGGIGGIRSTEGKENIDRWLSTSPARYVSLAYGTNDCWGNPGALNDYRSNTKYMIDAILAAGKIPVLPKIPYSTNEDVQVNLPAFNGVIDELYEEYGDKIIQGPDFYEYFKEHSDMLSDGVHPTSEGYDAMRSMWAEVMYERVYKNADITVPTEPTDPTVPEDGVVYGDANDDGTITIADATAILQAIGNPDKYGLSEQGAKNADCCNVGDGITGLDALSVQRFEAEIIDSLPETAEIG